MANAWTHLLTQTINYQTIASRDASGDITFAAKATTSARVQWDTELQYAAYGSGGSGKGTKLRAVIYTDITLPVGTRVWLPDDDDTEVEESRIVEIAMSSQTPGGARLYKAVA